MYRTICAFCFLFFLSDTVPAQRTGGLNLEKGQIILMRVEMTNNSFQTVGAQVINFRVIGSAVHQYTVTNSSANGFTLHHEVKQMVFSFDGMGQKKNFDSNLEDDLKGPFGPYFHDLLSRRFDVNIDSSGKVISYKPDKTSLPKPDEKMVTIIDMLKPLMQLSYPSKSGIGLFSPLPTTPVSPGISWIESIDSEYEKSTTTYTLSAITDSTILVDLKTTETCNSTSEKMGRPTKTNQNNASVGKIIIDRKTGILQQRLVTTDSKGNTEAMGGTVPVAGKTEVSIKVSVSN
jgi:hypothetical protein